MKKISAMTQRKINGKYTDVNVILEPDTVNAKLMHDLINKKLCKAGYIKSIKRVPNYDGTQDITVTYDNDFRTVYTVSAF